MFPEVTVSGGGLIMVCVWLMLMPGGWMAGAALAGIVHELGHIAAVLALGGRVFGVRLGILGARIDMGAMDNLEMLIAALAGPAAGAAVMLLWDRFPQAAVCALAQTLFNLLPLPGFDGARVLRAAVGLWKEKAVAK